MAHEAPSGRPTSAEPTADAPASLVEVPEAQPAPPAPDLAGTGEPPLNSLAASGTDDALSEVPTATSAVAPEADATKTPADDADPPTATVLSPPEPAADGTPRPPRTVRSFADEDEDEEEEEGGGPVKPFLDHLEDLRWTLIKVVVSILMGMLVCLVAGNRLVAFLTWPLNHAQRMLPAAQQRVPLLFGTNEVGRLQLATVPLPSAYRSNDVRALELVPVPVGDRWLLGLNVQTNRQPEHSAANLVVLKNYGPLSAFMVALKIALYGGLVVSAPFVIFFIGQFVLPALKIKEKKFLYRVAGLGSVLFVVGVVFCYLLIMQVALMASVQFSQWMGFGADEWRAEEYVSFVFKFMLGMGLSFQLPLVILTLVKVGLVDYESLAGFRQYFIVGNLVLSAVITPSGDPFTMVLMALPLQLLYEGSLLVARRWARQEREREAAAAAGQTP